ncbi:MAG: TraR/DksA family transcriptional regulator [Candidatus Portnoybacteria bacterium]|jgi:RNA polymerase-binding transcription factor DksA|nr:TraR/DksA family transcriptional regulator [Candidatus Portnoybacteria bacterium]
MDKNFLNQAKKNLLERKSQLEKELGGFALKDKKVPGDYDSRFPDLGTLQSSDEDAQRVTAYENRLSVEYALESRLAEINLTLKKIDKGTYGQCEKCGQPIGEKRLAAMPEAKFCLKCQK